MAGEGRYWLDQAFARDAEPSVEAAEAGYTATVLAALQEDFAAANAAVERVQAIAAALGDAWSRAIARHAEGAQRTRGDLGDADFAAAVDQGAALPLEDAISYALDDQPSEAALSVVADTDSAGTAELATLTRREREICQLVADGLTNQQIAARLVISPRTAESHIQNIMGKLGFTKRVQIAAWVVEQQHVPTRSRRRAVRHRSQSPATSGRHRTARHVHPTGRTVRRPGEAHRRPSRPNTCGTPRGG